MTIKDVDIENVEVTLFLKTFLEDNGNNKEIYSASFFIKIKKETVSSAPVSTLYFSAEERLDRYYVKKEADLPEPTLVKVYQIPPVIDFNRKIGISVFLGRYVYEQIVVIPQSIISKIFPLKIADKTEVIEEIKRTEINYFYQNLLPIIKRRGFILCYFSDKEADCKASLLETN